MWKRFENRKKNNREKTWNKNVNSEFGFRAATPRFFLSLMNAIFIRFYVEKKNQFLSIDVELKQENCIISLDVRIRYVPRFEMNFPG